MMRYALIPIAVAAMITISGCSDAMGPLVDDPGGTMRLRGVVSDDLSGQPLQGVTIETLPTTAIAVTADDGSFTISDVRPGHYTISCHRNGYFDDRVETILSEGDSQLVAIALRSTDSAAGRRVPPPAATIARASAVPGD